MRRLELLFILFLFFLGFAVRLYKINEPVADWHSFRQSDTLAVSQIFAKEGYNLLYPKYFDISNVQSGINNPEGYRFVEFPIYNFLNAFLFQNFGFFSIQIWGRLLNILASLITAYIVFSLLKKYVNSFAAYSGLSAFLFLPFSVFYSRVILPDVMTTTSIMLGIYFFDKYLEEFTKHKVFSRKHWRWIFVATIFTALAFLLKPFSLFFVIPMIYLAYKKFGFSIIKKWQLYLFAALSLTPLILWRFWISQFPEGIPASSWLFNGNSIRFTPAFFRWIIFERIIKLISGYVGLVFLVFSVFFIRNKNMFLFLFFALSSALYVSIIATGNIQHDYYQILIIPTICMFIGIGAYKFYEILSAKTGREIAVSAVIALFLISFYFSWVIVKDYFNINDRGMVEAAERVNEVLPQDALVIAPYDGSTTFLNLTQRRGWPVFQHSIEELINMGAEYLVIANPTENDFSGFGRDYEIVDSSDTYLILKLK